jgi:hypothetical protein
LVRSQNAVYTPGCFCEQHFEAHKKGITQTFQKSNTETTKHQTNLNTKKTPISHKLATQPTTTTTTKQPNKNNPKTKTNPNHNQKKEVTHKQPTTTTKQKIKSVPLWVSMSFNL